MAENIAEPHTEVDTPAPIVASNSTAIKTFEARHDAFPHYTRIDDIEHSALPLISEPRALYQWGAPTYNRSSVNIDVTVPHSKQSPELTTTNSLFYFALFKNGQLCVFDSSFNPVKRPLNGLYSFIYFSELMVVGYLMDYGSQHGGLNAMVQTLRMFTTKFRNHLFAHNPQDFRLPYGDPIAGGGILFFKGAIIFWHLKSGSYSLTNVNCHDNRPPLLKALIQSTGLPEDRFINVKQAEQFEMHQLRERFTTTGQFQPSLQLNVLVNEICRTLNLLPIAGRTQQNEHTLQQ